MILYVEGRPVPYQRVRLNKGSGALYKPRRYREWYEAAVADMADQAPLRNFDGPVSVGVEVGSDGLELQMVPLGDGLRPKYVRGDLDNYVKAALDALQGAKVIRDDRMVHHLEAGFRTP